MNVFRVKSPPGPDEIFSDVDRDQQTELERALASSSREHPELFALAVLDEIAALHPMEHREHMPRWRARIRLGLYRRVATRLTRYRDRYHAEKAREAATPKSR